MSEPTILIERNVEATMRDGTILRANIFRPDVPERVPVLLQRTPYGKDGSAVDYCMLSASRGFAAIVQDTRGRWASNGEHYALRDEYGDGYDSVEWAASQPWSTGKVGMWGGSYVGWTQWTAASTQAASLRAIFPSVTFMDAHADLFYPGGARALGVLESWFLNAGVSMAIQRMDASDEAKSALTEQLADALDGLASGQTFRVLPPADVPLLNRDDMPQAYQDYVAHETFDSFWAPFDIRSHIGDVAVPAYHLGGWYDIFCSGTLANYRAMREGAGSDQARRNQKLIMGPWLHGPLSGVVGDVDFGVRASDLHVVTYEIMWRWFDHWLKGIDNGIADEPPVRIFVMGRNRWREEQEWPLARAIDTPWFLHSAGEANSLDGDGLLSPVSPSSERPDRYAYDPRDPVPTRGGGLCCSQAALAAGAFDQREIEARKDVLAYTSEPLATDLEVTGPLKVVLWAASSAVDTDFCAKLVDVGRCGYARNLADGIVRARYRKGLQEPVPLSPGEVEEYVVDLAATSNVFLAGHRIRLEISSSNFPRFERNPNTGAVASSEEDMVTAHQTVLHDAEHPSRIVLPVVPQGASM